MWLSERAGGGAPARLRAGVGTVTVGGENAAVLLSGEARGLGVAAPLPSLGSLASTAINGMNTYPYLLIAPSLLISLIILSFNLFGDGLRDAFDPKLKK